MKENIDYQNCPYFLKHATDIDYIKSNTDDIKGHLKKLNGKVATHHDFIIQYKKCIEIEIPKNTDMRKKIKWFMGLMGFIGISNVGTILWLIVTNV